MRHPDVGIGQHRLGGLDVVAGEFWQTPSRAAGAPCGGEARLGALPDRTSERKRLAVIPEGRHYSGIGRTGPAVILSFSLGSARVFSREE